MAENRKGKDHRFYFTRNQLLFLGGAFVAAAVVIFFLGVFTGKGIEERRLVKTEAPLVKIPVKPAAPGGAGAQGGSPKDELTFYNTLSKSSGTPSSAVEKEAKPPQKKAKPEIKESKAQAKEEPAPSVDQAESKENGKRWTVQVNAFPDERSAKSWVDRLKNKGYNAYVTEVSIKGKTWYRVRVGEYGTREEARKVEETLKTKENYPKAFIASR